MKLWLHVFLTSVLGEGEWSVTRSDGINTRCPLLWDWVGFKKGLGVAQSRKIRCLLPEREPSLSKYYRDKILLLECYCHHYVIRILHDTVLSNSQNRYRQKCP